MNWKVSLFFGPNIGVGEVAILGDRGGKSIPVTFARNTVYENHPKYLILALLA